MNCAEFVSCHKFQTVVPNQPDTVQEPQHIHTIPNPTCKPSANRPTQNPSNPSQAGTQYQRPQTGTRSAYSNGASQYQRPQTGTRSAYSNGASQYQRPRTGTQTSHGGGYQNRASQAGSQANPQGYRYSQRSPPGYQATNYRKPSPSSQTGSQTYSNRRQAQPAYSGTDLASKMAQSILERILGKSVVQTLSKGPNRVVITTTTAPTTTSPLGEVEPPEIEGPTTTPTPTTTPAPAWPRQRLAASSGYLGNYWPSRGTQLSAGSGNSSAILYWKHTSAHAWWRCEKSCL